MNKYLLCKITALILVVLLLIGSVSAQQHYSKVRPQEQEVSSQNRSTAPGQNYSWVTGNWRWGNGGYIFHPGHWAMPPHRGVRWIPGRWMNTRFGWYWIDGYWSRRRR